jgi:hypothetical protein
LDFLKHSFKDTPILDTIKHRSIWLFSPAPGRLKVWNLITAEDWESYARPGMQLGMSISTASFSGSLLRGGVSVTKIEAAVSFETPLPHWAPYPEDVEFEFLYEPYINSFDVSFRLIAWEPDQKTITSFQYCPTLLGPFNGECV